MEPKVDHASTRPDPGSSDYDYSEIDRKSQQAEAEIHERIAQGVPLEDLTTLDDIKQQVARQRTPA